MAELPSGAIPYLGVTALVAATAYEIKLACENLEDLDELYLALGMEAVDGGVMGEVCHPKMLNVKEALDL